MYEFTEDCLTHIDAIDEEHRRLFQMLNEAISLSQETADVTLIANNLIAGLKDYAATHLAHEEAYMESIHDPELSLQKAEHAAFTKKMNEFQLDTTSPETARASFQDLLTYLIHWLYHHILNSDLMIVKSRAATTDDPFAFTDAYKTGINLVDEEHRRLFEIIRQTHDLIQDELLFDKYDKIMNLLAELRDYTEFHFHDEEMLMERIQYPDLAIQKRAHAVFIEKLVEVDLSDLDEMDNDQQSYLNDLIQFLLSWLCNHIMILDKKIAIYMRENHIEE